MSYVSKFNVLGKTVDIKDTEAREKITVLENNIDLLNKSITLTYIGGTESNPVGNCILLQAFGKTVIFDMGQQLIPLSLLNCLKEKNITTIDYIVLSHYHSDHIGGSNGAAIEYLFDNSNIDMSKTIFYLPHNKINWIECIGDFTTVITAEESVKKIIMDHNNTIVYPEEGTTLTIEDCVITFNNLTAEYFNSYYPIVTDYRGVYSNKTYYNNFSMICELKLGNKKAVIAADAGYQAQLLNAHCYMNSDVIDAPHHGLEREAPNIVLAMLHPDICVICGSTFYDKLHMTTPIINQSTIMGALLHYTTGTPFLDVVMKYNKVEILPETVKLFTTPVVPLTSTGGTIVPYEYVGGIEDFNDLTEGEYIFQNVTILDRFTNKPALRSGGKLVCVKTTQSNSVRQFYIPSILEHNILATRYLDVVKETWSNWSYVVSVDEPV